MTRDAVMEASVTETDGQYLFSVFIRSVSGLWAATDFVFHYPHADIIGHVTDMYHIIVYMWQPTWQRSFLETVMQKKMLRVGINSVRDAILDD